MEQEQEQVQTAKPYQTYAQGLRDLAYIWDKKADDNTARPVLSIYCYTKETLLAYVKLIGGSWEKRYIAPESEFASIQLQHKTLPVTLFILRDKVCKRTIKYDCEPMFSPDAEKELDSELLAA